MTTDALANELHRLRLGCRLDYRGDFDCGGGQYMCHTEPAERLVAAGFGRAATPAPLPGHQTPGEYHDYRVTCAVCGEPGFLHVSWRPETWTEPGSLTAALNAQEADHD